MTNRKQVLKQTVCMMAIVLSAAWYLIGCPGVAAADGPRYYEQVKPGQPKVIECDVAVYGGTPAGVTAAIQAAREGKKAVLLSFNRHVGGMTSGGLTATDLGRVDSIGGLAWSSTTASAKLATIARHRRNSCSEPCWMRRGSTSF